MDYDTYRKNYFTQPSPKQRFDFVGIHGATLYYQDYAAALAFYTQVLGSPHYVESSSTHGWQVGNSWLTLFPASLASPQNLEVPFVVATPEAVDALYRAFIEAGATGEAPVDTLMYSPVRMTTLKDPFGVPLSIICFKSSAS